MRGLSALTPRQREILDLVHKGLSNREIAGVLGISPATVKSHVEHLLRALDVTNRVEAAALASELARADDDLQAFAERPAVAVLRFDVEGDDPLARAFAPGLADDLIDLLCKWRWFPVIAKSTSHFYATDTGVAKLGELLGARYVIGGTVALRGDRLRVTARVDDATKSVCLWSDHFDLPPAEIFALQEEVAASVVAHAYPALFEAEGRRVRAAPPEKVSAWQLGHAGLLCFERRTQEEVERAVTLFDRALAREAFVLPLFGKGMAVFEQVINQWRSDVSEACAEVRRCAERAIGIDERDASGWALAGRAALIVGDAKRALPSLEQAVALNVSHARAHAYLGQAYLFEGDRAGLTHLRLAARLSPRVFGAGLPFAHFALGDYPQAVDALEQDMALHPPTPYRHALLCASLALQGEHAAARAALARLLELEPRFSLANYRRMIPAGHDVFDRIAEGMRAAGLTS